MAVVGNGWALVWITILFVRFLEFLVSLAWAGAEAWFPWYFTVLFVSSVTCVRPSRAVQL